MSEEHPTERAPANEHRYWLDDSKNVDKVFWGLVGVCAALWAVDFFLHRHVHYGWEAWAGFYGVLGFVAFWCLVIAGKYLRKLLMRDEDYYDR